MGDIYCGLPDTKFPFYTQIFSPTIFYSAQDSCRCSHCFSYNDLSDNLWQQLPEVLISGVPHTSSFSILLVLNRFFFPESEIKVMSSLPVSLSSLSGTWNNHYSAGLSYM